MWKVKFVHRVLAIKIYDTFDRSAVKIHLGVFVSCSRAKACNFSGFVNIFFWNWVGLSSRLAAPGSPRMHKQWLHPIRNSPLERSARRSFASSLYTDVYLIFLFESIGELARKKNKYYFLLPPPLPPCAWGQ